MHMARKDDRVVNAMTIDVEDYFHVSVFDGLVPRHAWGSMESRVCANTERLLELFDETGVTATFFILGWSPSASPGWSARSRPPATRSPRTATSTAWSTT